MDTFGQFDFPRRTATVAQYGGDLGAPGEESFWESTWYVIQVAYFT